MNFLTVLAIASVCLGSSAAIIGTLLVFMMVGEINRKRGQGSQVPYITATPWKQIDIIPEYRRLYPEGHLHLWLFALVALMVIAMLGLFASLYLMGRVSAQMPSGQ